MNRTNAKCVTCHWSFSRECIQINEIVCYCYCNCYIIGMLQESGPPQFCAPSLPSIFVHTALAGHFAIVLLLLLTGSSRWPCDVKSSFDT